MVAFDDFGEGQGTLHMGHPVEIETKGDRPKFSDQLFDVATFIIKHF